MTELKKPVIAGLLPGPAAQPVFRVQYPTSVPIVSGEQSLNPARFGFVHSSRTVGSEAERITLVVRREQVQTVEDTYRFIGAKFQVDDLGKISFEGGELGAAATDAMSKPSGEGAFVQRWAHIADAFEITIFVIVGAVLALMVSPYSPFGATAERLLIVVMPGGAALAIGYALVHQRRHRLVE